MLLHRKGKLTIKGESAANQIVPYNYLSSTHSDVPQSRESDMTTNGFRSTKIWSCDVREERAMSI
jgi:hypothetical protein